MAAIALVASVSAHANEERVLEFFHTHTGDSLRVVYYKQGQYDANALADIRVFLADWRDGIQHDLDPQLMDILWQIQLKVGTGKIWEVISAYRSPETNAMLNKKSSGVAKTANIYKEKLLMCASGVSTLNSCVILP